MATTRSPEYWIAQQVRWKIERLRTLRSQRRTNNFDGEFRMDGKSGFRGNARLLFGIIFGVLAFWLFAQTTLNISPVMATDLGIGTSLMNIAVSITALFSGIFIVVIGSLADRFGRVKMVRIGFVLSIIGSLLVGLAPS